MYKCLIVLLCLVVGCTSPGAIHYQPVDWDSNVPPPPIVAPPIEHSSDVPANIQTLLRLHNEQRKSQPPLALNATLMEYAQRHAEWMASHNKLEHSDISQLMGKFYTAGENIAWNQQTENEVVEAWMNSPGHRANILNRKFTQVGFGVAYNRAGEPYWCTCFGS